MTRRGLTLTLLWLWLLIWGLSVGATYLTMPTGDGFTRGMNRLALLVGGQAVAALIGVAAFIISRPLASARLRRAAWVPLILALLLVAAITAPFVIVWREGR